MENKLTTEDEILKLDAGEESESEHGVHQQQAKKLHEVIVVVLAPQKPLDWDTLEKFQSKKITYVWMEGLPTRLVDLERCSFRL